MQRNYFFPFQFSVLICCVRKRVDAWPSSSSPSSPHNITQEGTLSSSSSSGGALQHANRRQQTGAAAAAMAATAQADTSGLSRVAAHPLHSVMPVQWFDRATVTCQPV